MLATSSAPLSADHNLLFGILALQMDFVNRDALIQAMNAWVLHKSTSLGQILLDQGALRVDTHALLQALVKKHLEMHGGDAQKSLASVSSLGSARQQLQQIADADVQHSLALVVAPATEDDPFATQPPTVGESTSTGERFRILRPYARGGLGEVFVARDTELNREVALKEIQTRHADDLNSRSRFVLEAEITGGLEHPGIVPVYGLGTYADGRPYYAMRFIQGDSLQEAIARFHSAEKSSRDPGERTLALRQLLGRFVDVCDAIAYAHSRGVLHRDLKPGNIMLGPYGETLVIDWGLAKTLGNGWEPAKSTVKEQPLKPTLSDSTTPTQVGSAVGTPAYMPPEQAAGRIDSLGPTSDVYSLGATLYCLLTGKPPFEGTDVGEVLRRVQCGDCPSPRTLKPEVPAALEAVCRKAMALRPEERYVSPRALAADVECWLADEPVSAWREPWRLRVGRWTRRHRTPVVAGATALLLTVLAAGAGAWWLDRERREQRHGVESALEDMADLQAQRHWAEAGAVLRQARERLGSGGPRDLCEKLDQAEADLNLVARLDAIRLEWATLIEGRFDRTSADRDYERAFQEAGLGEVGSEAAQVAARISSSAVRDAIVVALDDWLGCGRKKERRLWIVDVLRHVDPDPWRDAVRDPATRADATRLAQLAIRPGAAEQSPQLLCALAGKLRTLKEDAEPVLRLAQKRYPEDFWVNLILGDVLRGKGKPGEAVGFHRAALAVRPGIAVVHLNLGVDLLDLKLWDEAILESRKASELDPCDALAHNNLALALRAKGQLDNAIAEDHKALKLNPKYANAHSNLGNALRDKRQLNEAIVEYRKAIEFDPKHVNAHMNLGVGFRDKGQLDEAIAEYRKAIELNPKYVNAHINLGIALRDKGQLDEAVAECRKAIELIPANASAHYNLGLTLTKKGAHDEAIAQYYKASALDPKNTHICLDLGYVLSHRGRRNEAIAEYRKAIQLDPKYALAHNNLSSDLRETGHVDEAIAESQKAIELNPKLALAPYNLGLCLAARGEPEAAIDAYRKAIELDPRRASAYNALGSALADKYDTDAAITMFRKAMEIDPKLALAYRNLALALKHQGELEEATTQFRRAMELDPKNAWGQEQLARCQRMLALEKKSDSILKGDVRLTKPSEQLAFAELCLWRERPAAAVCYYDAAFTARPQFAEDSKAYRYDAILAAARAAAGRGKDVQELGEQERQSYHRQAIRWLHDHLAMRAKQIEHGTAQEKALAQKKVRLWQRRADFDVLRDPMILETLPDADQAACRKLWNDVAALLKK